MSDEIRDGSWRDGPTPVLKLLVFRQAYGGLEPVEVPAHIMLEDIVWWLKQSNCVQAGARYTVLSVATEDEFEIEHTRGEVIVSNVHSVVY